MNQFQNKGACCICGRDMFDDGFSIDQHHFIPKSRGGLEKKFIHRVCHQKIHSLWTVKQLEKEFSDPDVIIQQPEIQTFLTWIMKKDPLFYEKTVSSNAKKQKKGRGG